MPWQEVSPGRFERPLGALENFFVELAAKGHPLDREHWTVTAEVSFRIVLPEHGVLDVDNKEEPVVSIKDRLLHTWKVMRYRYPELAATVDEEAKTKVYIVPTNEDDLSSWVAETFVFEPEGRTVDELYASFRPASLASVHYIPLCSTLVFHTSHWRLDGIGAILLTRSFLETFGGPHHQVVFGDEAKNLCPSLEEAAHTSPESTVDIKTAAETLVNKFLSALPSFGFPSNAATFKRLPGASRRSRIVLDEHTTAQILHSCKTKNRTVTAAVSAALIVALREMVAADTSVEQASLIARETYTQFLPFDLRSLVAAVSNDPSSYSTPPVSVYMTGLPVVMKATSSFQTLHDEFTCFFRNGLKDASSLVSSTLLQQQALQSSAGTGLLQLLNAFVAQTTALLLRTAPPEPEDAPTMPVLEGLGNLDKLLMSGASYFGHEDVYVREGAVEKGSPPVRLNGFWLGVENITREVYCYQWTFNKRLELSACWNESFYERNMIEAFLGHVKDVLVRELGQRSE